MKKKLSKLFALVLALALTASLTACGGDKDTAPQQSAANPGSVSITIPDVIPDVSAEVSPAPAYQEITLSQHLSSGETIWFRFTDTYLGKDTTVNTIFVLESDGSLYRASAGRATLGQLEQMADADIVAMVKEGHAKACLGRFGDFAEGEYPEQLYELFMELFQGDSVFLGEFIATYLYDGEHAFQQFGLPQSDALQPFIDQAAALFQEDTDFLILVEPLFYTELLMVEDEAEAMAIIEDYVSPELVPTAKELYTACKAAMKGFQEELRNYEAPAGQYKLSILSDHTGNKTEAMALNYRITTLDGVETDSYTLYYMTPAGAAATNCGNEVYDSTFGGYSGKNGSFLTRMDSSCSFVLDQIGESDLPIDVEAKDLFN